MALTNPPCRAGCHRVSGVPLLVCGITQPAAQQDPQEVVPLNASNVVMGADVTSARHWIAHVERTLSAHARNTDGKDSNAAWSLVVSKQMVGVLLVIWARASLVPRIQGVQALSVPTGVLGLFGNKGAVAVRLRLDETGLALVCSHLSSGDKPGDDGKRNADYATIIERGVFSVDDISVGDAALARRLRGVWGGSAQGLLQHDHVVWMGDLNYRLRGIQDAAARAVRCELCCFGDRVVINATVSTTNLQSAGCYTVACM